MVPHPRFAERRCGRGLRSYVATSPFTSGPSPPKTQPQASTSGHTSLVLQATSKIILVVALLADHATVVFTEEVN